MKAIRAQHMSIAVHHMNTASAGARGVRKERENSCTAETIYAFLTKSVNYTRRTKSTVNLRQNKFSSSKLYPTVLIVNIAVGQ